MTCRTNEDQTVWVCGSSRTVEIVRRSLGVRWCFRHRAHTVTDEGLWLVPVKAQRGYAVGGAA